MLYLGFDGGGTKSLALLFDERGPLGAGKSGGTNVNFTTMADCRQNIATCLDQALAGQERPVIETLYSVIVGPFDVLREEIERRAAVRRYVSIGEGEGGLLSGMLRPTGLCAMAGTGSDVFYHGADGSRDVVGAFGAILGDDGGGAWIGQQALRRVVAYGEGWGTPTLLRDLVFERWGLKKRWDLADAVYESTAPFRKVASAVPIVAEAANLGDQTALSLLEEAGRLMAAQALALIRRRHLPPADRVCVCVGGAWKAHPAMHASFVRHMREGAPEIDVQKPHYEHIMAGPVLRLVEDRPGISQEEIRIALGNAYDAYRIKW